ncbi:MAG: magnesium transporter [Burkholderiaceae bacterium]|nr:magnesium transporter [Burkholderiaceae bacterium]
MNNATQQSLHQDITHTINTTLLNEVPAVDVADLLNATPLNAAWKLLAALSTNRKASVFGHLRPAMQADMARLMSRKDLALLFEEMEHDERADLYKRLSESERQALLPGIAHAEREDIRLLASYPEGTVGSVMTSAYVTLRADQTVAQALDTIRLEAPDKETIYQAYVLDVGRHLVGAISLRDLILAAPSAVVEDIMVQEVIQSQANAPRTEATRQIAHYDLIAVPVVNEAGQMVGIVMHDDALDVTEEESTEDQLRLGAVGRLAVSLKDASIGALYRTRVGWLVILVFGNIFSGAGIAHFESLIESMVALVFFLPLLVDSGGNAGSQSATLMVRALATGEIVAKDWVQMLGKEILVALLLGLSMAFAVSLIGFVRAGPEVALIVSITMVLIVIVGSVIGMLLPFLLTRFKLDPASASAPLITSICDGVGVLIYFNIANLMLVLPEAV